MSSKLTALVSIILCAFISIMNLTAQETSIEVIVYDSNTNDPIESASVSILWDGVVLDSVYTDINGRANIYIPATNVREPEGLPTAISLSNNYPNPFNDKTNVEMSVPEAQTVTASVYNILGQRVASEQIRVSSGNYTLNLSLGHLPKGVYFLRVGGSESKAVKLTKLGNNVQYSGTLFSVSPSSLPGSAAISKTVEEVYMLRAYKDQYDVYETSITGADNGEIEIPLTRNGEEETGTVTDIDGNVYNTVSMGMMDEQGNITYREWMAENLKVTHYRNGDPIIGVPYWSRWTGGDYDVPPDHYWSGTPYDVSGGFPGTLAPGETRSGVNFRILNPETWRNESFFAAVEEMIDAGYDLIGPEMYFYILGTEGLTTYEDGLLLANETTFNENYNALGAYTHMTHGFFSDITTNEDVIQRYGLAYNWYAVTDQRGLCPEGWHIPSDEEWRQIERYIISIAAPELSMAEINNIVGGIGWRGAEHDTHNINLGGRLKTQNSAGMEIGIITGNQGDNYVTAYSSYEETKIAAHLEVGDVVRIANHYNAGEEFTVTAINLPTVTLDGTLADNFTSLDPTSGAHLSYIILISKNGEDVVSREHPSWGEKYTGGSAQYINAGNSEFAGGGTSGLDIVSSGWVQRHRFHPNQYVPFTAVNGIEYSTNFYPEHFIGYRAYMNRHWTITGEDEQGNPLMWTPTQATMWKEPEIGEQYAPWWNYPGELAAMVRRFMATSSGVVRTSYSRRDGCGVRCVKID